MTDLPQSTTRYISAARANFEALTKLYGSNGKLPCDQRVAFWKLGNTFDTMMDFLDIIPGWLRCVLAQCALRVETNPDLQRFLAEPEYQTIIRASADAALLAPIGGASFEQLTNNVSILVAATAMLKQ